MDSWGDEFFLGRRKNRSRTCYSSDEVTDAINKINDKHPQALLSVEDLDAVVDMTSEEILDGLEEYYDVQLSKFMEKLYDGYMILMKIDNATDLNNKLLNSAFLQEISYQ